jgi:hypothetical protein
MNRKLTVGAALILVIAIAALARSTESTLQNRTKESLAGIWKGKFEGAPAIEVELKVTSGNLAGTVTFYVVQDTIVTGKATSPLIEPSFDGHAVLFKVKRNDGSLFKARMRFVADNEAVLKPVDDATATDAMAIQMTREK